MAPKAVRDVHPETFIKAYAAHLKANDKVSSDLATVETARLTGALSQDLFRCFMRLFELLSEQTWLIISHCVLFC